ncbi:hypothetical protein KAU88_00655 [Candidatus Bathyarchaeota archaeon]|nr:hypothetical protein [Candidatus Bathyarchaeota archaeon]
MVAPLMSHVICTSALIVLIFVMPFYYFYIIDNVNVEMMKRELKEVADYVSNSLGNLYFLANSTNCDVVLQKDLDLPSSIRDSTYFVEIVYQNGSAQFVRARLKDNSWNYADSWLLPGLKAYQEDCLVESSERLVVAGCVSNSTGVWVWLGVER